MYKTIYVPTDNSEDCRHGIDWGIELAKRYDATLIGSHVYAARLHDDRFRQLEMGLPAQFQVPDEIERQRKIHDKLIEMGLILISDSFIDVIERRGQGDDVRIERKLLEGIHFEQLAKDINHHEYDLVIMGAHGIGKVKRSQLGSVTNRLSRLITADLLVMRNGTPLPGGHIVVAVDGSAYAYVALRRALGLARDFGCTVEAVSAFDPYMHYAAFNNIRYVLSEAAGKVFKFEEQEELHNNIIDRGLQKVCEANLLRAEKVAADQGHPITTRVLIGKPFAVTLDHVEEAEPALLVFGRYGAHHTEGADMGSQAENLLRASPVNVLVVGAVDAKPYDIPVLDEVEEEPLEWEPEAMKFVLRAPPFAQLMAKAAVEEFAREHGHDRVTLEVINEGLKGVLPPAAKHLMGMALEDRKIAAARQAARSPIEEYAPHQSVFTWTEEARRRVEERVPAFVRPMAVLAIERHARERGLKEIGEETVREVARRLGYEPEDGDGASPVRWTEEGEARLSRVPKFEREMVRGLVETHARKGGHAEITRAVVEEAFGQFRDYWRMAQRGPGGYLEDLEGTTKRDEAEATPQATERDEPEAAPGHGE